MIKQIEEKYGTVPDEQFLYMLLEALDYGYVNITFVHSILIKMLKEKEAK